MSKFFKRFPWSRRGSQSLIVADSPIFDPDKFVRQIDRKIHPDLNSLLKQEHEDGTQDIEPPEPLLNPMHIQAPASPHLTALTSSVRRRSHDTSVLTTANSTENEVQKPDLSLSSSTTSNTTGQNISGETFGRRNSAHRGPRKTQKSPTTPRKVKNEAHPNSQRTTPGSQSGHSNSHSSRSRGNTVSSSNTFGVPSPTFTPVNCKPPASEPPPLPPLDHPAFKTATSNRKISISSREAPAMSNSEPDELGHSKLARHSYSLPSFSHLRRAPSDPRRRNSRPRLQSKPYEFFAQAAKSSTPILRRRTHKRSYSNVSQSSSRRASAEFSALQAASVSHGSREGSSWEVQVSREMLRMSLGEKQGWSENGAASKSGHARGDRYRTQIEPTGTATLGSPFLLQDANTHHTSAAKHCSSFRPSSQVTSGISNRKIAMPAASTDSSRRLSPAAQSPSPPARTRTPSPATKINTVAFTSETAPSSSHLAPPSLSFTAATPTIPSPIISPILRPQNPGHPATSVLRVPETPPPERPSSSYSKGKRKADEAVEGGGNTPPKDTKEPRATFAVEPRPHRASANSNSTRSAAPSSYHRKRARLSTTPESRPGSRNSFDNQSQPQNAATTGSWSSKASKNSGFAPSSNHHQQHPRALPASYQPHPPQRAPSRRSLSQASIPMSALISPHAPSISRSTTFHMRDPRKPAPVQRTSWSLSFPTGQAEPGEGWRGWVDRGGSPLHAWMFFIGFILFPLWWVASFTGVPKTRRLDAGSQEKGVVVLDDPQVEHDAMSWRMRCRVMAVISLFTYIPFIVCVAIFA